MPTQAHLHLGISGDNNLLNIERHCNMLLKLQQLYSIPHQRKKHFPIKLKICQSSPLLCIFFMTPYYYRRKSIYCFLWHNFRQNGNLPARYNVQPPVPGPRQGPASLQPQGPPKPQSPAVQGHVTNGVSPMVPNRQNHDQYSRNWPPNSQHQMFDVNHIKKVNICFINFQEFWNSGFNQIYFVLDVRQWITKKTWKSV